MQVESSCKPLLTIDEVEKVQRQKLASFIGHVFQLTYAATVDLSISILSDVFSVLSQGHEKLFKCQLFTRR